MSALKLISEDSDTIYSLDFAHEKLDLACEFLSDNSLVVDSTLPSFVYHLLDLNSHLISSFANLTKNSKDLLNFFTTSRIETQVEKLNFINISTILIVTPEGFTGKLNEYGYVLTQIYSTIITKGYDFTNEMRNVLARIVTNKSDKISSKGYSDLYNAYMNLRLDAEKALSRFNDGSTNSRKALGNVIDTKKELIEVLRSGETLSKNVKSTNIDKFKSDVGDITGLLTEIRKQIKDNSDTRFSAEVIQLLANGSYELAKYIEYISSLIYRADVYVNVITDLKRTIEKNKLTNIERLDSLSILYVLRSISYNGRCN